MHEPVNPKKAPPTETLAMTRALVVSEVRYDNSAAQFWPAFFGEVRQRHPAADRIVLSAHGNGPLHPGLLMPEHELSQALERIDASTDFAVALNSIAAEVEAAGPPERVEVSVFGAETLLEKQTVADYLDAEIFPFLLVWLLEWSRLNEAAWNRPRLRGGFTADDPDRPLRYRVGFVLESRHLTEGLFHRSLTLQWSIPPHGKEGGGR